MRTKKEIEEELHKQGYNAAQMSGFILEVVLDIRELLEEIKNKEEVDRMLNL